MSHSLLESYLPVEKYHIIKGCSALCGNSKEQHVYDDSEINTPKIQKYIKTHRWDDSGCYDLWVDSFELKKWSLDDVIKIKDTWGKRSHYFENNGFNLVCRINLIDLFDHPKIEQHEGYHEIKASDMDFDAVYNLVEKKKEIKSILEKIDYQNRDLLIYRSLTRSGYYGHADYIDIFEHGEKS
jgi:hypothetical protein